MSNPLHFAVSSAIRKHTLQKVTPAQNCATNTTGLWEKWDQGLSNQNHCLWHRRKQRPKINGRTILYLFNGQNIQKYHKKYNTVPWKNCPHWTWCPRGIAELSRWSWGWKEVAENQLKSCNRMWTQGDGQRPLMGVWCLCVCALCVLWGASF